eukprot:SAG31_NODE_75_length_27561_cov_28.859333_5_plen_1170_part_00
MGGPRPAELVPTRAAALRFGLRCQTKEGTSTNKAATQHRLRPVPFSRGERAPELAREPMPVQRWWGNMGQHGAIILMALTFLPAAEGSAAAAIGATASRATAVDFGKSSAHYKIDVAQLGSLNVDPGLKHFLGTVVSGFQMQVHQFNLDREALQQQLAADKAAWDKRNERIEEKNTALRLKLQHEVKRVTSLERALLQLTNKTATELRLLTAEVETISVRLDQREEQASSVKDMERRRRMQNAEICHGAGLSEMFAACCPNHGGHRRSLQDHGCDVLPDTCPVACAPLFIDFFEGCEDMISDLTPTEQQAFAGLYADCTEMAQQQAAISDGAKPALMFHMVVIDQEAEQQQAAMFDPGSGLGPASPLGPVVLPPASSPTPSPHSDTGAVQEFQRVCSRANLTVCAPQCNPVTEGYLLSVLIEGRGTLMTCNQEEGVYSWQGQSALGSCITKRGPTWLENIMTHAAGTFALELSATISVVIAADLVAGQSALLHGVAEGQSPVWTFLGEGPAFVVGAGAELEITAITVAATSGLAFRIADSSTVVLSTLQLQKGDGSADAISCAALATGVGQAGLTCADTGFGGVNVAGPLFISTSGAGFGTGATKYMGSDRSIFEEAVSTREPGLYTCQISHDEMVTLTLPVESAMHVSIVGDDSMARWRFTGEGLAFTVAVHAYLDLAYVIVPGGQVSLMRGGEISLDHVQMQGAQLHVAGALAASNSQLTDVQFETEAAAVITMDSVTLSGTGEEALVLSIGCSTTINGVDIRNVELQVTRDGELIVTGSAIYVEGMAVAVATGGSFTVSTSQLIHGDNTDPFPCNGADMACTGPHAGSVVVAGPASINTAAPLVCADESAGSCLSGYIDMPSCLADIARGMENCFVYLQRDTGELGTISVSYGEHFEIHGNQGEPKLRLLSDFGVAGVLILADLQIVGGSGDGSQMSVETGGELTLQRVEMEGGSLTFAGAVSLMESSLVEAMVTGSLGSELSLSGGTISGSTLTMSSGRMMVDGGCVLADSPVDVGGAGGAVTISGVELQSDGSSVPLTIEADGAATVNQVVFRSNDGDITAVSVAEGGSFTVSDSQLIKADGSADPFPCDGTLPNCTGAHAGSVLVEGPSAINMAAPLVCDVETGECLSMPAALLSAGATALQFTDYLAAGMLDCSLYCARRTT